LWYKENMNIKENQEYFRYLFNLQKSGRTNMFGAGQYLREEMGLHKDKAREIITYWMRFYEEIAKELNIAI
jgi:hypothetical protein